MIQYIESILGFQSGQYLYLTSFVCIVIALFFIRWIFDLIKVVFVRSSK